MQNPYKNSEVSRITGRLANKPTCGQSIRRMSGYGLTSHPTYNWSYWEQLYRLHCPTDSINALKDSQFAVMFRVNLGLDNLIRYMKQTVENVYFLL